MSSEELKPCPFCGGDVSFHKDEECDGCHFIQCGQCRAFFDFATGADPGNDCESVDALHAAIAPMWNTRAQLAAIQGGMGEEPLVVATAILGGLFHGGSGPELGDIDVEVCTPHLEKIQCETVDSSDDVFMPLMTVAQHQRILAASVPAGCKVVPVELLEQIAVELEHDNDRYFLGRELRALLASAEGVKDE